MPDGICPTGECNVVDDDSSLLASNGDDVKTPQTPSDERRSNPSSEDESSSDELTGTDTKVPLEEDEARFERAITDLDNLLSEAGANG